MITKLLLFTGAAVWALFALSIGLGLLNHPRIRRWLERPARYPYTFWLQYRLQGLLLGALERLRPKHARRIPPEVVAAFRSARLEDYRRLKDVLQEVDALPTVQSGLAALGLKSIFEVPTRAVHRIRSPYTDRLQRPAYYLPGVPARTFYDPSEFEWVKPLEQAFPRVKRELVNVLRQDGEGFKAYMSEGQQRLEGPFEHPGCCRAGAARARRRRAGDGRRRAGRVTESNRGARGAPAAARRARGAGRAGAREDAPAGGGVVHRSEGAPTLRSPG